MGMAFFVILVVIVIISIQQADRPLQRCRTGQPVPALLGISKLGHLEVTTDGIGITIGIAGEQIDQPDASIDPVHISGTCTCTCTTTATTLAIRIRTHTHHLLAGRQHQHPGPLQRGNALGDIPNRPPHHAVGSHFHDPIAHMHHARPIGVAPGDDGVDVHPVTSDADASTAPTTNITWGGGGGRAKVLVRAVRLAEVDTQHAPPQQQGILTRLEGGEEVVHIFGQALMDDAVDLVGVRIARGCGGCCGWGWCVGAIAISVSCSGCSCRCRCITTGIGRGPGRGVGEDAQGQHGDSVGRLGRRRQRCRTAISVAIFTAHSTNSISIIST